MTASTKACTRCRRELPATPEFFVRCSARKHKDGLFTLCKVCRNAVVNKHNQKRSTLRIERAGRVPGCCDVCGVALTPGRGPSAGCWDHNHGTGEFRGWLCGSCNKALGLAGDNPLILERLAAYLRANGHHPTRHPQDSK